MSDFTGRKKHQAGTAYRSLSAKFFIDGFQKDLGAFDAQKKGRQLGQQTPQHQGMPKTEDTEHSLQALSDHHRLHLSGVANEEMTKALETIRRTPEDLNPKALVARTETEIEAIKTALVEESRPLVMESNDAHGERNKFRTDHECGPLPSDAYTVDSSKTNLVFWIAIIVIIDAMLNAMQFMSVLPRGAVQALVIASALSLTMSMTGAMAGTASRYWNYKIQPTRRRWKLTGLAMTVIALIAAGFFAQYRALLEQVALRGGEPNLSSVFHISPTFNSITVFIGAAAVFVFSALKFRGGPGTPWALYGDYAEVDRPVRIVEMRLKSRKSTYLNAVRGEVYKAINGFHEQDALDRALLKEAYAARDTAKLHIRDLRNSDEAYFNLMRLEIERFRNGVMAVRTDLKPEDFGPLPQFSDYSSHFPDVGEIDLALSEVEQVFVRRNEQLADLENAVGQMEQDAIAAFEDDLKAIAQGAELTRNQARNIGRVHPINLETREASS
jgi:hypothetical protein